jgi:hypothetical protein
LKSVGDFYVNIIPKLDQIALNTGISAVNSTMEIASKAWGIGKKAFGFLGDTSKVSADMVRFADSLKRPIEMVETLQNMFELVGLSVNDANAAMQGLIKSASEKGLWGNADWARLSRHGLSEGMFTGDPFKDIVLLNRVLSKISDPKIITDILSAVNLPLETMQLLGLNPKEFKEILDKAQRLSITNKDARANMSYQNQILALNLTMDKFKAELVSKMLPELTSIVSKLNQLLTDKEFMSTMKSLAQSTAILAEGFLDLLAWLHIRTPDSATPEVSINDFIKNKDKYNVLSEQDLGGGWKLQTLENTGANWTIKNDITVNGEGLSAVAKSEAIKQVKTMATETNKKVIENNTNQSGGVVR